MKLLRFSQPLDIVPEYILVPNEHVTSVSKFYNSLGREHIIIDIDVLTPKSITMMNRYLNNDPTLFDELRHERNQKERDVAIGSDKFEI